MDMIGSPFGVTFCADDGTPLAICGLEPIGDYRWRSHFIFAEGFQKIGLPLTRFLKKITDKLVTENKGDACIEIHSAYGDGKPFEWFRAIGFQLVETGVTNRYIKKNGGSICAGAVEAVAARV
jgi:hypothetical protein